VRKERVPVRAEQSDEWRGKWKRKPLTGDQIADRIKPQHQQTNKNE
jgi:hypothetical protein